MTELERLGAYCGTVDFESMRDVPKLGVNPAMVKALQDRINKQKEIIARKHELRRRRKNGEVLCEKDTLWLAAKSL